MSHDGSKLRLSVSLGVAFALLLLALLFAALVWPTRYAYEGDTRGIGLVRIDRLTGKAEMLTSGGWLKLGGGDAKSRGPVPIPPHQVSKITGTAEIDFFGRFEASIYNGSECNITSLVVAVEVKNADGSIAVPRRRYNVFPLSSSPVYSLSSQSFRCDVGFRPEAGQTFSWDIVSAHGYLLQRAKE